MLSEICLPDEADDKQSNTSSPDDERDGEQWTRSNENLLRVWCEAWATATKEHARQHRVLVTWQTRVALPSVALPLIFSPLSNTMKHSDCEGEGQRAKDIVIMVGFIACSISSAASAYFQWGVVGERHLLASRRYADLISDTEEILAKQRRHRSDVAIALRTLKDRSDYLLLSAPPLPVS